MEKKKMSKPEISGSQQSQLRIKSLLAELEKEFDILFSENANLHLLLSEQFSRLPESGAKASESERPLATVDLDNSDGKKIKSKLSASASATKAGYKTIVRAQTSRIVSSFKAQSNIVSKLVKEFSGVHTDGVWEVSASNSSQPLIATSSADHVAALWSTERDSIGRCLLKYEGHQGSVNSVKFHPAKDLLLTGSGDNTAHIWAGAVNLSYDSSARRGHGSSEEELEDDMLEEPHMFEERERIETLRTPVQEFAGHTSVVVAADWISSNDSPTQIITASWDRTAILWDIETKASVQTLSGHDNELTHCSSHATNRLVVTASRDSTFRLWDFRTEIPAVSVFQGHSESVTSTIFTKDDKVISGSDDKTVKVWELRNMRQPLTTIRTDSPVNRLSVSTCGIIAIPHDNRSIRLFDLNGQRIARLQRSSRTGHTRMVSSVVWKENSPNSPCNLFSSGFDKKVFGWQIKF